MGKKSKETAVLATCPVCGKVELKIHEVNILLRNTGVGNAVTFRCNRCLDLVEMERIGKEMTATLVAAGVAVIDQMVECLSYPGRPPLNERDFETFTRSIAPVDYLAAHARMESARYRRQLLDAQ